jgi:hypothetical protein
MIMQQQFVHQHQQTSQQTALLANQIQHQGMAATGGIEQQKSHTSKGANSKRSEEVYAALCSLAGVTHAADLPIWWPATDGKTKADIKHVWKTFKEEIREWATSKGLPIQHGYEPTEDVLWSWMCGELNGSNDYYAAAAEELTPYAGMVVSREELKKRKINKAATEASMHTRTRAEALQIETEKGEPPSPPADYYTLLHTLVAFTGIVWMLLGEKADLYQKLLGLVDILRLGSIEPDIPKFDGVLSRQIFWMVIVDVKRYCSGALTVQMLRSKQPPFPTSGIHNFIPYIREVQRFEVQSFPEKWKKEAPASNVQASLWQAPSYPPPHAVNPPAPVGPGTNLMGSGEWFQQLLMMNGLPPMLQQQPMQFQGWSPGGQTFGNGDDNNPNVGKMPPRVTSAIKKVHEKFKRAGLSHLVTAAGKTISDLPTIKGHSPCYSWLMGKCTRNPCTFRHCNISDMSPAGVQEWTDIMEAGAAQILSKNALPQPQRKRKRENK